jgi:hypothetical protein
VGQVLAEAFMAGVRYVHQRPLQGTAIDGRHVNGKGDIFVVRDGSYRPVAIPEDGGLRRSCKQQNKQDRSSHEFLVTMRETLIYNTRIREHTVFFLLNGSEQNGGPLNSRERCSPRALVLWQAKQELSPLTFRFRQPGGTVSLPGNTVVSLSLSSGRAVPLVS